ncbi:DUF4259 domain-containing protein [Sanguibacter antarcticus]|uniref:Uncharacterized protein DUF4259 n=1 Tax=Sanguibacter antarcticus TaxID=372484 RepID=A0A2A9E1J8_9MICO|nr:DUF4259 domain-containing protein [Sanguibacter antarcticus]PFG32724.1 uncharacterized protein DUF4259 [Sanguibacter antarcticus]
MGAWGTGPFENDGAGELLASIRAGGPVFDTLGWAIDDDYLEVDGGQIALALVDLALVCLGTRTPAPALSGLDLAPLVAELSGARLDWILALADRTLSGTEASELYELWEETDTLAEWLRPAEQSVSELKTHRERTWA